MLTITKYTAKRSGAQITVSGFGPDGKQIKRFYDRIAGPDEDRVEAPEHHVGYSPDGRIDAILA